MRHRRFPPSMLANDRGSARTIGTVAGAVIGAAVAYFTGNPEFIYLGASIGATLGGVAGGLYETANADGTVTKQESIADLRIQTSTLGQAIPQVFGGRAAHPPDTVDLPGAGGGGGRLAGNIIWATQKIVHEHRQVQESPGGKGLFGGGPENVSITKTYTISLAIGLCDTRISGPMATIQRIWRNANLLYDINEFFLADQFPANWTFYTGTADQLPDPTIEADLGVGNVPGYRYLCYLVMTNEELGPSGQLPQWSFELGQAGETLTTVVTKLCGAAGLSGDALDVTGLPEGEVQLVLVSIEAVRASLEHLALVYRFYGLESGTQYAWRSIGTGGIVATIPEAEGSAGENQANEDGAQFERAAPLELPTLQYLTYSDQSQSYQRNTQPSAVILPPSGRENPKNLTTPLTITANQARHLSTELVALAWVQRESMADVLSRKWCHLEPGDKVNLESRGLTYPVVLAATTYGAPGLVEIAGRVNGAPRLGIGLSTAATVPVDQTVRDATTIPPGAIGTPGVQTTQEPGDTTPLLLNLPVLSSSDQAPRYHVAYVGETEPWPGGVLYRSVDSEATYQVVSASSLEAVTGTVATPLPGVDWAVLDTTTTFHVVLEYGTLNAINDEALAAGLVRAMIGAEMVYIGIPTLTATREYDCTRLWRGRQGTEWAVATHGADEAFVLLDASIRLVPMVTAERGVEFSYKAVTRGQPIADAATVLFTPVAENLTPWQVLPPLASRPVQDWQIRWYERSRFVPGGRDPDYVGFLVTIFADATFTTIKRTISTSGGYALDPVALKGINYTAAQQVADFASVQTTLYFTVAQVGAAATGRSVHRTSTDVTTVQSAIEPPVVSPGIVTNWVEVTAASYAMAVGTGYEANRATLVTLSLPTTAALGDTVQIVGRGAGGWKVSQAAGQSIHAGRKQTTVGVTGSLASRHAHDAVTLVCIVANAVEWEVTGFA